MAVTYEIGGNIGTATSNSVDAGSGANRVLSYFVGTTSGTDVSPTATYNGVSMTRLGGIKSNHSNTWQYYFVLRNPASGSNTLAISGVTLQGSNYQVHNSASQASDPTGYQGLTVTGTNTGGTLTVTTSSDNSITTFGSFGDEALTASTGLTINFTVGVSQGGNSDTTIATAGAHDMVFTKASNANLWCVQGAAIAPAPSALTSTITETTTVTETPTGTRGGVFTILETTTGTDTIATIKGWAVSLLETFSLTETISGILNVGWSRQTKNTATLTNQIKH